MKVDRRKVKTLVTRINRVINDKIANYHRQEDDESMGDYKAEDDLEEAIVDLFEKGNEEIGE